MKIDGESNNYWRRISVGCTIKTTVYLLILAFIFFALLWNRNKYTNSSESLLHGNRRIHQRTSALPLNFFDPKHQDYQRLVDLNDFYFTIIDPQACNATVFLLVLVSSAPNHLHHRNIIRTTWGQQRIELKIFFVFGRVHDKNLQKDIEKESDGYGDVIQGNFLDTYRNLTYKTMTAFKFVLYHCNKASYVLKIDDDAFVNMPLLLNFLKNDLSANGTDNLFLCNVKTGSMVNRDVHSKWYISEKELSNDYFPSYCSGWYTLLSPDVIFRLYATTQKLKYISVEDAFIYGIARQKANITQKDFTRFTLAYRKEELLFNGTYDSQPLLFGAPNMSPELIKKFWLYFRNMFVLRSLGAFSKK
ncbi:beta-1,3-galactosyltransferase 5-like [Sitophilus oryzae]|uniref:Hexosyltransferase n=1 Tax=Sitophilus oryzae TaxID=7048 RepID=A0A6J2Y2S9_SITOR|nr:beta-1,3-galactosyltransferase 5-like [Sitophilus oryzae]